MSDTSIKPKKPEEAFQPSGLAPFITQGTVATDNLSFMITAVPLRKYKRA